MGRGPAGSYLRHRCEGRGAPARWSRSRTVAGAPGDPRPAAPPPLPALPAEAAAPARGLRRGGSERSAARLARACWSRACRWPPGTGSRPLSARPAEGTEHRDAVVPSRSALQCLPSGCAVDDKHFSLSLILAQLGRLAFVRNKEMRNGDLGVSKCNF